MLTDPEDNDTSDNAYGGGDSDTESSSVDQTEDYYGYEDLASGLRESDHSDVERRDDDW